jgi:hypothetical protein
VFKRRGLADVDAQVLLFFVNEAEPTGACKVKTKVSDRDSPIAE